MNDCFAIIIKEKGCQNCANMRAKKALTSVSLNEVIPLSFGYQLSITNIIGDNINILVTNPSTEIITNFIVLDTGDILLDLPLDNGCYRVYIAVTFRPCTNVPICPTIL